MSTPIDETTLVFLDEKEYLEEKFSKFGTPPKDRAISDLMERGIIVLDKPSGPTSHEVVSIVKRILDLPKAGHSGTLDPQVTGVLPIALNTSTKILYTLLTAPKTYICNMFTLGEKEINYIEGNFEKLSGLIYQFPPQKSNVAKKLRKRKIYDIELIEVKNNEILFRIRSQAGTYIRTICTDYSRITGKVSYMKELRRIVTGPFNESETVNLHYLFDAWNDFMETGKETKIRDAIQPIENAVAHLPKVILRSSAIRSVCHGADLKLPGILGYSPYDLDAQVAMYSPKHELLGIGQALIPSSKNETLSSGVAIHPRKIIYPREIYP